MVPLTASTRYESVDLSHLRQFTATGKSLAVQLGLPVLTLADRMCVVTSHCARVADSNGRMAPGKLPSAVVDCLAMVGGSPLLLSYLMEAIAGDGHWMDGAKLILVLFVHASCLQRQRTQLAWVYLSRS